MNKSIGFFALISASVFGLSLLAYGNSITINFKNGRTVVYDQAEINSITFLETARPPSDNISGRDGHFIAYNNGTVLDTKTNLMWAAKDNGSNINWANAKSYCENYRGGGYTDWRMPTQDELAGLYDATKNYNVACGYLVHLTELIRFTCMAAWASETRDSSAAYFNINDGRRSSRPQSEVGYFRVIPVRSGK